MSDYPVYAGNALDLSPGVSTMSPFVISYVPGNKEQTVLLLVIARLSALFRISVLLLQKLTSQNERPPPIKLTNRPVFTRFSSYRVGFALIEVLVCIAIIATLMSICLPAVQKTRNAACRVQCLNNVRQIGLATHAYEQQFGILPLGNCGTYSTAPRFRCFSPQAQILPFVDQQSIASAVDWADESPDSPGTRPIANIVNRPLLKQSIAMFQCPADGDGIQPGASSYRQSVGFGLLLGGKDPLPPRLAAITDGLANTALFSERLVGGEPRASLRNPLLIDGEESKLALSCVQAQLPLSKPLAGDPYAGTTWLRGSSRHVRYSHLFPPNSRFQDCELLGWIGISVMSARSDHPGGVNVIFADGHATFINDSVPLAVWRAWGTPNGGEIAPVE